MFLNSLKFKFWAALQQGRGYDRSWCIALPGSVEDRLRRIADNNEHGPFHFGVDGGLQVMTYQGSKQNLKNLAASKLLALRHSKAANISLGRDRNSGAASFLENIAAIRRGVSGAHEYVRAS